MSLSNLIRIPLDVSSNIDVFTFGESSLFGYDSLNSCIIVHSLSEIPNSNNISIERLHLSSSSITFPIQQLILNNDETILALISDQIAYLVYLPQSRTNHSPSQNCRRCPVNVVPPLTDNCTSTNNCLIDFIWLSSFHFVIVYSIPSSSECHLYVVRPSKEKNIKLVQTFCVGSFSRGKLISNGTPNKILSLRQPSDIVKLDVTKRKTDDLILLIIFAMKADGDIFIMEIDQNHLLNSEEIISSEFVGPVRIYPSRFDNYGGDHSDCRLLCLSCSNNPVIIFARNKCLINECIYLNPSSNEYCLFTIDSINLSRNETNPIIKYLILDRLNSNRYYLSDSLSNVYSIEISWIDQINNRENKVCSTNIEHLIQSNCSIEQMGLIQTKNKGQWLAIITKTENDRKKELIVIRPQSLSLNSFPSQLHKNDCLIELNEINEPSEFVNRIRSILTLDQSIPDLRVSSTNICDSDFQKSLLKFMKIFSKEFLEKQEKVRQELQNKERYLSDFEQIQLTAQQELNEKFKQIEQTFQILIQQFQKEYSRRKDLSSHVDELLSVIEQHPPVLSDAQILMHRQFERYQIQINSLTKKVDLLKEFLSRNSLNKNEEQINEEQMEKFQRFAQYHTNTIDQMKKQLQTIHNQK